MRLSPYGSKEWGTATAVALALLAVCLGLGSLGSAVLVTAAWIAAVAFFRDPRRKIPVEPGLIVAPADGVIDDIEKVTNAPECEMLQCREAWRIGIFLSVFNVHINRAPCDLEVLSAAHRDGNHGNAMNRRAELKNESNTLMCRTSAQTGGVDLVLRQISGAVARRIVCTADVGSKLHRGQQYGMIKYGSRTQLYIPVTDALEIVATNGAKMRAGESVLAKVSQQ